MPAVSWCATKDPSTRRTAERAASGLCRHFWVGCVDNPWWLIDISLLACLDGAAVVGGSHKVGLDFPPCRSWLRDRCGQEAIQGGSPIRAVST